MPDKSVYLDRIQREFPDLMITHTDLNQDGLANDIIIVNHARIFRFPKEAWAFDALRTEIAALNLIQRYVELPVPTFDYQAEDMVAYTMLQGDPLFRDDIFRSTANR